MFSCFNPSVFYAISWASGLGYLPSRVASIIHTSSLLGDPFQLEVTLENGFVKQKSKAVVIVVVASGSGALTSQKSRTDIMTFTAWPKRATMIIKLNVR